VLGLRERERQRDRERERQRDRERERERELYQEELHHGGGLGALFSAHKAFSCDRR
jgi:hypothetical protein